VLCAGAPRGGMGVVGDFGGMRVLTGTTSYSHWHTPEVHSVIASHQDILHLPQECQLADGAERPWGCQWGAS
jgi:hypothetical protein